MITIYDKTEYIIPSYFDSAIVNDDYSGLSDKEEEILKQFLETLKEPLVWISEEGFCHDNDITNEAGGCSKYFTMTPIEIPKLPSCPKCSKELVEEDGLSLYPFVCHDCDENFYLFETL